MSEHVFRELDSVKREVKNNEDKVDGLIDLQSDGEGSEDSPPPSPAGNFDFPAGDENIQRILHAMGPGHKPFRTLSGLSGDSSLDTRQVSDMLGKMQEADFVRSFRIHNNKEVFSLTPRGRQFFQTPKSNESNG
ncbi:hypothetical protein [Membranihabitans maritimus]|uniref:hypothetical protein n=1 Tax=Membranihabitans maritimus TaxID=2904244 RepID=UPI001F21101C|nr:hypothetical protein [Membranihabitans maritimus]